MGTDLVALDLTLSEVDILVGYQVFMLKCFLFLFWVYLKQKSSLSIMYSVITQLDSFLGHIYKCVA